MPNENVDARMLLPILKQIPLFSGLEEDLHMEVINHIILMYYPANYILFKEGDEGDAMYIIKSGQIQIYHEPKEEGDLPEKVAEINEKGFFGEMALVSDVPRNASAQALTDCEVFILSRDDFKKLLSTNESLAGQVSATIVARTNENDKTNL